MALRFEDEHGNEMIVKSSFGLTKFHADKDLRGREEAIRRLAMLTRFRGQPLVDMDEVLAEIEVNHPTATVEVRDYAHDTTVVIEIDAKDADPDESYDPVFGGLVIDDP